MKASIEGPALYLLFAVLSFAPLWPQAGASAQPLLDPESQQCLNCHADSAMTEGSQLLVCHMGECDHPIGIDYTEAYRMKGGLANPATLDKGIRLFNNRIGCATCHVPYNEYDHEALSRKRGTDPNIPDPMLSVDSRGSGLCLQCHKK